MMIEKLMTWSSVSLSPLAQHHWPWTGCLSRPDDPIPKQILNCLNGSAPPGGSIRD